MLNIENPLQSGLETPLQRLPLPISEPAATSIEKPKRKRIGAPKGSKNAVGNRGGVGGPVGNKFALKTGRYEKITPETLTPEELKAFEKMNFAVPDQIKKEIILCTIRERRIMERIKDLLDPEKPCKNTLRQRRTVQKVLSARDAKTNRRYIRLVKVETHVLRKIDALLALEEALTGVQACKCTLLELQFAIDSQPGQGDQESALRAKAHAEYLEALWQNR